MILRHEPRFPRQATPPDFLRNAIGLLLVLALGARLCFAADDAGPLQLILPPKLFATAGLETGIYYDNIVLAENPGDYRFEVSCDIGRAERNRWKATPGPADIGDHLIAVTVLDSEGAKLGSASTTLQVTAADAGTGQDIRLLIVGDSLTHASLYPNEIARLLSLPGNPDWKMLGTHKPSVASAGVAHEGYGGWSWVRFVSRYEPDPDDSGKKGTSPFVYLGAGGKPALDVKHYIAEECDGEPSDFVTFLLGINDCFSANSDDLAAIDARVDQMIAQADILIAAFRNAAPRAELGICLTTPPNTREEAFQASYKGRYSRFGWKKIQHRLVQREIERFAGHEDEQIFLVPTGLNLDTVDGYSPANGVHPNGTGYKQIGASIYSWLKARLKARA